MNELSFATRHQGPFGAVNGGYLAGVLGETLGDRPSSVRINEAVPTDTPLFLFADDTEAHLRHCDRTVASATLVADPVPETGFVPIGEIVAAPRPGLDMGMFADCFVCSRPGPDGLGLSVSQLDDGRFAAIWRPGASNHIGGATVPARYLRAALDCPGGFAVIHKSRKLAVTGTLTSRVDFLPPSDETLVVVGEATYVDGRKHGAVTTIFTESDDVVATATAVWVALGEIPIDSAA